MRYIDTEVFRACLAPKDAVVAERRAQVQQLAGTLESKNDANIALITEHESKMHEYLQNKAQGIKCKKPLQPKLTPICGDGKRYKSLLRHLDEAEQRRNDILSGESLTHYQINHIRAEMAGTTWSPEAHATLNEKRAAHEGWGEKAVRIMRGLPHVVTQEKRDMEDGDIKRLDNGNGGLQSVQVGRCGLTAYLSFVWELASDVKISKYIDRKVVDAIKTGELPKEMLEGPAKQFPYWLLDRMMSYVLPSDVIGQYGDIYCAYEFGYVVIPQGDADDAWTLISITKGKPRYGLRKAYSLQKMLEESAAKEEAPLAA